MTTKKSSPSWIDVKAVLAGFDRAALLALVPAHSFGIRAGNGCDKFIHLYDLVPQGIAVLTVQH